MTGSLRSQSSCPRLAAQQQGCVTALHSVRDRSPRPSARLPWSTSSISTVEQGRIRQPARSVRVRQDDDPDDAGRLREAHRRDHQAGRSRASTSAAAPARDGRRLPELRPVSAHDRRRECRVSAWDAGRAGRPRSPSGSGRALDMVSSRTRRTASPRSFPAASSSASR